MKMYLFLLLSLLISSKALAFRCTLGDFEQRVQGSSNVLIGRVVGVNLKSSNLKDQNKPIESYKIQVIKVLKSNGLFKKSQKEFVFPAEHKWGDYYSYKKGQLILFFFHDKIFVKCNYPVVLE